jgi:hypothetical protein
MIEPSSLIVRRITELPFDEELKIKGQFLSTLACPKCTQGYIFGFLALPKNFNKPHDCACKNEQITDDQIGVIPIDKEESVATEKKAIAAQKRAAKKKTKRKGVAKKEDGTIDLDAPPTVVREVLAKRSCIDCKRDVEVPSTTSSEFNIRCSDCLKALIRKQRG